MGTSVSPCQSDVEQQQQAQHGAPLHRGLNSSTFRLNVSAFCRIVQGLFCGCVGGVRGC